MAPFTCELVAQAADATLSRFDAEDLVASFVPFLADPANFEDVVLTCPCFQGMMSFKRDRLLKAVKERSCEA